MKPITAFLIGITIVVIFTKACCMIVNVNAESIIPTKSNWQAKQYLYKLAGFSDLTGERVIAYLNPYHDDPSRLVGIIYEGYHIYHAQARWDGKGLVYAETILSSYTLEVIE